MTPVIDTSRPRGLREPRKGYFTYDAPNGQNIAIGRVPAAVARAEAEAANAHYATPRLLARLTGAANTVEMLLAKMPVPTNPNTAKQRRAQDKIVREALGSIRCAELTVADCAAVVEGIAEAGKARMAEAVRSHLVAVCRRGMQLGWMPGNPAEVTRRPKVEVKRGRLTLEMFNAIYDAAGHVAPWLRLAMQLAIVTGADRASISRFDTISVGAGYLTFQRPKTLRWIKIPLRLQLKALGWSLGAIVDTRLDAASKYLVHHVDTVGYVRPGDRVHVDTISAAFTQARRAAGIPDVLPDGSEAPTFHEIRSLAKREYLKQGGVDTLALLGHTDEKMGALYADNRGVEPVTVAVD